MNEKNPMVPFGEEIERLKRFYGPVRWKAIESDPRFCEAFAEKNTEKCVELAHMIAGETMSGSESDRAE